MARTYPRYLGQAQKKIGKVYPSMRTTGTLNFPDSDYAFHVSSGKVTTYKAEDKSNLLRTRFNFHATGSTSLTKENTIRVRGKDKDGSGICEILEQNGAKEAAYYVYKDVDGFAAEVQREIDNAPS